MIVSCVAFFAFIVDRQMICLRTCHTPGLDTL